MCACGEAPTYRPVSVDDRFLSDFDAIATEANHLLGYKAIAMDSEHGQGLVRVDDEFLTELGNAHRHFTIAVTASKGEIVMRAYPLPYEHKGMYLAHEIGHTLGLDHTDHGLMQSDGDPSCVGREGRCLVEALRNP